MPDLVSRTDLDFLLYEWLAVPDLTRFARFADHSRETFDGLLDLSEQLAEQYFAPHNRLSDATEPTFDGEKVTIIPEVGEALRAFADADLLAAPLTADQGGFGLPNVVYGACMTLFGAANAGSATRGGAGRLDVAEHAASATAAHARASFALIGSAPSARPARRGTRDTSGAASLGSPGHRPHARRDRRPGCLGRERRHRP